MKTITLKEWLNLNPTKHKKTVTSEPGDQVRVHLHGGEGVERSFSGVGADEERATEIALDVRERMRQNLA